MKPVPTPAVIKQRDPDKWQMLNTAYGVMYQRLAQQLGKPMIIGHTHQPEITIMEGGLWIANCGDMVDSFSSLDIVDGVPELKEIGE